jgi:hypothetical protein
MALETNTILLLIVLAVQVGVLFALRKMYALERQMAALELVMGKKTIKRKKRK